jgi:hypothetical protein
VRCLGALLCEPFLDGGPLAHRRPLRPGAVRPCRRCTAGANCQVIFGALVQKLGRATINLHGDDEAGAAMQQIADWLEKLGMSEYAECFAENGINVAALPHLTDQDLKDIKRLRQEVLLFLLR